MGNSDKSVNVLRIDEQMPSSKPESLDYTFSQLRGAITHMNLYGEKVQHLRRQLEKSEKVVKSMQYWKDEFLETVYRQKRHQQSPDGTADAPPHRAAPRNQTARLEDRLESRLRLLERLLSQHLEPRRVADVGVQAGEAGRPKPSCCCRRREAWWPEAAAVLWSACLMVGGLLISKWSGGVGSVVIHIGQESL